MHLSEISFCSKIGYNIKLNDAKQRILEDLERKFRFKVIQKHYEKYVESTIVRLNNNPHMISVRTNGNPYLLYLTRFNFVNQCVFIDKKIQQGYYFPRMIISKFRMDDDLFEGTLFDGEMVKDHNGNWIFIISDVIGYNGTYLDNVNLVKRMNMIYNMLQTKFIPDDFDVCKFQVKRYFRYDEIEQVITDFIPRLRYSCRGIYFKPMFLKFRDILMNFDDNLIQKVMRTKYKSVSNFLMLEDKEQIIADKKESMSRDNSSVFNAKQTKEKLFYVKKTSQPDVYEIVDTDGNNQQVACIPTLKVSKMMREIFLMKNVTDKVLMRCEMSENFNRYVPVTVSGCQ